MKPWMAILLLLPAVAASPVQDTTPAQGWMDEEGGAYDLHGFQWQRGSEGTTIQWDGPLMGEVRVLVLNGHEGAPEAGQWWLLHVNGNETRAWEGTEAIDARFSVTGNTTRAILPRGFSPCTFAVANVHTWDNGLVLQDAVPDSETNLADAWRGGDLCDGAADTLPQAVEDVGEKGKDSPLGVAVLLMALAFTLRRSW